jgi:hypothetical protein
VVLTVLDGKSHHRSVRPPYGRQQFSIELVKGWIFLRKMTLTHSQDTSDLESGLVKSRNALGPNKDSTRILRGW